MSTANLIQLQKMKILKLEVKEALIQTWMTSWKILEVFQSMQETVTREWIEARAKIPTC